ncbi:intradiol ring-cleavage dioxygenase [Herbiconiux ginsengi]|uniref:Hydroxyquinol 1,2-dioxygenase n=1 Tax=Herbiconiux ginsengi TaxID=381665 RepID=A0A1H3LNQ4_9MICO|nr:intradiol ring-cleavage dioxygenase [Herbiconiux ginsengi]SDY65608.1 hydroxyquinol 1,2-dioxygenase [Herbiconiux ginsengi]
MIDQQLQSAREHEVTDTVVASFGGAGDARFKEVMTSLVRHLHGFAREVRLTTAEWDAAIAFLTRAGHITDDHRQEFILLSDVLGLSMLTVAINAPADGDASESTVFGPFFVEDAPEVQVGADISGGLTGLPCWIHGTVTATDGTPIPDARIEVWAADDAGFYDVQYDDGKLRGRAHFASAADGRWDFWTVQPAAYPIPHDGPVGDLLTAAGRGPMRPAHVHFMVSAPGYRTLITHIFVKGDEWLDDDAVFGVKDSLIVPFVEHGAGTAPDGRQLDGSWSEAEFSIVLAPAGGQS